MLILRLDLNLGGDSRVPLVYRIAEGEHVREIRYLPQGKRRVSIQEFMLKGDLTDDERKACAARLAGTD
jgi:hypothetical protein